VGTPGTVLHDVMALAIKADAFGLDVVKGGHEAL
jgi:hypothetical protein